uniref:TATA-binding protein interacting (TIP20) domain-containing protein n=1 Tax=Aplanochytrium stocchinoi TaxID=215587 RepID=A0A7S3V237_9STRA
MNLCEDEDLQVRRTALLAINSLAHHHPSVILPHASSLVEILYREMSVKSELMRKVDLGPFKHTIDDGLPLRKASFACMSTFIDTIPHEVNVVDFLPYLSKGLSDVNDVQMMCHQIVSQLCSWAPVIILANVSTLLNPLTTAINKTVKEKKNTDVDRTNDVIRSAVRALFTIAAIPEASQEPSIQDLCDRIQAKPHIAAMLEAENLIRKR